MRVVVRNGDCEVELSAEGSYAPDAMNDMCTRALKLYLEAFPDEDAEAERP